VRALRLAQLRTAGAEARYYPVESADGPDPGLPVDLRPPVVGVYCHCLIPGGAVGAQRIANFFARTGGLCLDRARLRWPCSALAALASGPSDSHSGGGSQARWSV